MAWLNINQSLSSIRAFASEVLSEEEKPVTEPKLHELEETVEQQQQQIELLQKQNAEYKLRLQAPQIQNTSNNQQNENADPDEEPSSWFWDPPEENENPLKKENDQLHSKVKDLQAEICHMKESGNHSGNSDVEILRKQLNMAKEENNNLTHNIEDLDNQNQVAMEKLLNLKKDLQNNYEYLQRDYENLKVEHSSLKNRFSEMSVESQDVDISELKEANAKANKSYETLHQKYDKLEKVHRLLKENTEKFQEENQYMSEENTRLTADLETIGTKCEQLENSLKDYEKARDENQYMTEENSRLTANLETVSIKCEQLLKNYEKVQEENHELNEENFKLQEECAKLQHTIEEEISKNKSNKSGDKHKGVAKNAKAREQDSYDSNAHEVIESLKYEIVDLQNKLNTNEEIKRLNLENVQLRKDIESLNSSRQNSISCDAIRDIVKTRLSFDIEGVDKKLKYSHTSDDILKYLDRCLQSFTECKIKNDDLETRVAEDTKEIDDLKSRINDINSEMYILNQDLSQCEHECSEMKKNNDFLIAEIGALKSTSKLEPIMEQNEDNMVMLQSELEVCSNLNKNIEAELEKFKSELTKVVKERDEMKETMMNAESDVDSTSNADLQRALSDAKTDIEKYKSQICSGLAENEKLKIDISIIDNEKVLLMKEISEISKSDALKSADFEKHKSKIEEELTLLRNSLAENQNKLKNAEAINDKLQNELSSNSNTISLLNNRIKEMEEKLSEVSDLDSATKAQLEKTLYEFTQSKNYISEYESKYNELVAKNQLIETQLVETQKADQRFVEEKQNLMNSISKLNESKSTLEQSLAQISETKDIEILALNTKINDLNEVVNKLKNDNEQLASLSDELKENISLQSQKAVDDTISDDIKNLQSHNDELEQAIKSLENEKKSLESRLNECDNSIKEDQIKIAEFGLNKLEMESQLEKINAEKNELINLITQKHNENIYYHTEIQRINGVLLAENQRYTELESQLQNMKRDECENCRKITQQLKDHESKLTEMNAKLEEYKNSGVTPEALENLTEKNQFLAEKCDVLTKSLLQEQTNAKHVAQDKSVISEREQSASKEVERLRRHLLEKEEAHTHELVSAEQKYQELQTVMAVLEEKAKHSNTLYTSNSIRANQEVETLRNQIRLVEKQRDDIQANLYQSEDKNNKNLAALTNLQCVLEQFQMDKNRDNDAAAGRVRRDYELLQAENQRLLADISGLQDKLRESNNGLKAAARLSSQLDARAAQLNDMKDYVSKLEQDLSVSKKKYDSAVSNQQDKVDKTLIKNMIVNFIQASEHQKRNDKLQVLRILSNILDFDQNDSERVGLGSRTSNQHDSFTQEFVKFLEKESRPTLNTVLPNLLNLGQGGGAYDSGNPPSRRNSKIGSPVTSDSPHSVISADSRGSPQSQTHQHVPLVPVTIDNIGVANTSPITVGINPTEPSTGNVVLNTALSGFSLFTPIASPDVGVNQTRNTEGAILKNVLKDT